ASRGVAWCLDGASAWWISTRCRRRGYHRCRALDRGAVSVSQAPAIAVLRTGSLGDHLIAFPIYRHLRQAHSRQRLVLISNIPLQGDPKRIGPSAILPPGLFDQLYSYPVGSNWRAISDTYRLFGEIGADTLYYLMPWRGWLQDRRDALFFRLLG